VSFKADWLALREPHDNAARNPEVLAAVAGTFAGFPSINVVDLACGTGSTLRAISSRLPARQIWRLVDNDLSLLARAKAAHPSPNVVIHPTPVDLGHDLEAALDGALDVVTTSALLDLVSAEWLERLVIETAARRLPVYAALTYDGRAVLEPGDPFDTQVTGAMNRHQRNDKGFGPSLGPAAAESAVARFKKAGHTVVSGTADWVLGPSHREIQLEVLAGWASAAREMDELDPAETDAWLKRRRDLVAGGRSTIRVGHGDVFARPMPIR
jgi:SAM-dependent methyltransferase